MLTGDFLEFPALLSLKVLNNTRDNMLLDRACRSCLTPTVVGKGRPMWMLNSIELVELYNDVMMLISSLCVPIVVMICHILSYHTLSKDFLN